MGQPLSGLVLSELRRRHQLGRRLWYRNWEGHGELVKLNLHNPDVVEHQFQAIRKLGGAVRDRRVRLDVAYCLPTGYLKRLRAFTQTLKPDFALVGEVLGGDYNLWIGPELCHSVTNYECYKGLWSSFNDRNLFEIGHSLARQYGPEPWTLYKGPTCCPSWTTTTSPASPPSCGTPAHLPLAYALLFGMPGTPPLYYGSEWGIPGEKPRAATTASRPALEKPEWNSLTGWIARLAAARRAALPCGRAAIGMCSSPTFRSFSSAGRKRSGSWWRSTRTASPIPPTSTRAAAWPGT